MDKKYNVMFVDPRPEVRVFSSAVEARSHAKQVKHNVPDLMVGPVGNTHVILVTQPYNYPLLLWAEYDINGTFDYVQDSYRPADSVEIKRLTVERDELVSAAKKVNDCLWNPKSEYSLEDIGEIIQNILTRIEGTQK